MKAAPSYQAYKWMTLFGVATVLIVPILIARGFAALADGSPASGSLFVLGLLALGWLAVLARLLVASLTVVVRGPAVDRWRIVGWYISLPVTVLLLAFEPLLFFLGLLLLAFVAFPAVCWFDERQASYQGSDTPAHESGRENRSAR